MNEQNLKIGQSVRLVGKQLEGRIAYIGTTNFANGKWIGVILKQKLGKNNGTVQGISYFKCPDNYGIFVRPTQLIVKRSANNLTMDREVNAETFANRIAKNQNKPSRRLLATKNPSNPNTVTQAVLNTTNNIEENTTTAATSNTNSSVLSPEVSNETEVKAVMQVIAPPLLPLDSFNKQKQYLFNLNENYPIRLTANAALVPKRSKTFISPSNSFYAGKRPLFVETGFVEILRPQFIPGSPLRSPSSTTACSIPTHQINTNQIFDLQQQLKELQNKLNIYEEQIADLKRQNSVYQQQLVDQQQLRSDNEQLLVSQMAIDEQHTIMQRELEVLKVQLKQCDEVKIKYQKQLNEANECIDLLTLDKEICEETNETIQIELDALQEKNELLMLDVEILKVQNEHLILEELQRNEMNSTKTKNHSIGNSNTNPSTTDTDPAAVDKLKLEAYNERLWQTVLKLRDVLTLEKQNTMKLVKELNTCNSEIAELKQTKDHMSQRCDQLENQIGDMREQLDAVASSEIILSTLTNAKLELEDKVRLLEEEVAELEALEEIHEQLVESNQELEKDLREEIEHLNCQIRQLLQEKDGALEGLYERECTIMKFRTLIKTQNAKYAVRESNSQMDSEVGDSLDSNEKFISNVDFHQLFANTKAYSQNIDLQLAVVEVKIANNYSNYMKAFLPEDLLLRGGVHDLILVLLLLQRTMEKIELISSSVIEKFPAYCEFDRDAIFECYSVQAYAFRTRCLYLLRSLHMILQQLEYSLNYGIYEVCLNATIYRNEMETKEHYIDELIALLKKGLFDENTNLDNIEVLFNFYSTLLSNLLNNPNTEELLDEQLLNVTLIDVYDMAMDCIDVNASLLSSLIQIDDEHIESSVDVSSPSQSPSKSQSQSFSCLQYLMKNAKDFKQQLKHLHKQLPNDCLGFNKMPWNKIQRLDQRLKHLNKLINLLNLTVREASKNMISSYNNNTNTNTNNTNTNNSNKNRSETNHFMSLDQQTLWRIMNMHYCRLAAQSVGEQSSTVVLSFFEEFVQLMLEQMQDYHLFIADNEKARSSNLNTFYVRSNDITIYQQAAELKQHYDKVKQLQQQLLVKDNEIKSLKHLTKMKQNDYSELQIRKDIIERNLNKLDSDQQQFLKQLANKTNDILDDIQNRHIQILQILEHHEQKLCQLEKVQMTMECHLSLRNHNISSSSHAASEEIERLQYCLRQYRQYACLKQTNELTKKLKQMEPLHMPNSQQQPHSNAEYQQQFRKLTLNLKHLKNDWILNYIAINQRLSGERHLRKTSRQLVQDIWEFYSSRHAHRFEGTDFGYFLTSDMKQVFE